MSTGDIQAHLAEIYGTDISRDTISRITDAIVEDIVAWQNRPLDRVYPVILIDAIVVKIRDGRSTACSAGDPRHHGPRLLGGHHVPFNGGADGPELVGESLSPTESWASAPRTRCVTAGSRAAWWRSPKASVHGAVMVLRGSTITFAWCSGLARVSKALATPSRPTVPVMRGLASSLPWASMCRVSRNSRGP